MNDVTEHDGWQPLSLLARQFRANIIALRERMPKLADELAALLPAKRFIRAEGSILRIAIETPAGLSVLPNPVTPPAAQQIAQKLCPTKHYTVPLLVAGLDQGWLWQTLHAMPISSPALPGHRPPIYMATNDLERLWMAMHLHDWRPMLADERVRLFAGADAFEQLRRALVSNDRLAWPRTAVTVEPSFWPAGENIDRLVQIVQQQANERLTVARRSADAAYAWATAPAMADRLRSNKPLRILGITSRYTTFLQYSMRDWLDAFRRMGHETRLVIEEADHEALNNLVYTQAIAEFRPDLVVLIDHYRAELSAIPDNVPCVMWVQDQLPNIFSPKAGAAQRDRDYCLGFGRLMLSHTHGYPAERFLPAQVSVNEKRFAPRVLPSAEMAQYGCDVSFVSHASVPADRIVADQIAQIGTPEGKRLLTEVFDRLRAVYEAGAAISHTSQIQRMIDEAMAATRLSVPPQQVGPLFDFFTHRANNALFRHQTLHWLAEMDVNVHLYGRGWENHPTLSRFARGIADNQTQLNTIYQASKVNLQVTPHGAVHQRLLDGLSAGGFFLVRYCPGDLAERIYKQLWAICQAEGIRGDDQLLSSRNPRILQLLGEVRTLMGVEIGQMWSGSLHDVLQLSADGGYIRSAGTIWPEYEQVAFASRDELHAKVTHFLTHADQRRALAESMRRPVIERFSYVSINRSLLDLIATDLEHKHQRTTTTEAAAA